MAAVEQRIDELVFRSRVEGVEQAKTALDNLAQAHTRAGAAADANARVSESTGRRLGNLDRDLDSLQKRLAGAPTAWREYERGIGLVNRALDAGKIDAVEYGKTITDLQARLQKVISPRLGVSVDKTGIAALLDGQQQVSAATRVATRDLLEQAAAAEQAAQAQARMAVRFGQTSSQVANANDNIRLTTNQVGNLGYQLNDVATMLAMGASPFQVISSQAGQVVQALGDGPGGVKGSLQAIGTAALGAVTGLGPVALGFGAVAVAAAGFAYAFRESFPDMEETLKRHEDILGRIGDAYGTLQDRIREAGEASGVGLNIEAGSLARDLEELISEQTKALENAFIGINSFWQSGLYQGANSADVPALPQFDAIREQVEAFRQTLRDGNPDVAAFQQQLADMYQAAQQGGDVEMQRAIEAAFRLTEGLADLERRAASTKTALEGMAGSLPSVVEDIERFGGALDYLKRMNPEGFDTLREGLIDQADALTQATEEANAYGVAVAEQQASIAATVDGLRLQVDMFGQSAGAIAAARFETQALAEAQRAAADAGEVVSDEQVQAIRNAAGQIGTLTDELRSLNEERRQAEKLKSFDEDLSFRMEQLGRSEIEQRVAQQLRSIGMEYGSAQASMREGQLRYIETIEATRSEMLDMGEVGRDVFGSIIDAIGSGENAVESLIGVFANLGKQLASLGAQKLFDGLFGTGQNATADSVGNLAGAIGQMASRPSTPSFSAPAYSAPAYSPGSSLGQTYAAPVAAVERAILPALTRASSSLTAAAKAIRTIESGSAAGNYGARGPVVTSGMYAGERALGAYQIMPGNLPEWSKAALGRVVSNVEFLSSPKLQDAVFEHRFGGYMQKYGPEGAAQAWFGGPGSVGKNLGRQDVLGTSVSGYGSRFSQLYAQHSGSNDNVPAFSTREMSRAVSDGNLDATRRIATGAVPGFTSGTTGSFGPLMSPQAGAALANGWSGFGPTPGQGGATGGGFTGAGSFAGIQYPAFTAMGGLGAGLGGFGQGYQSGSPVSGGLSGALGGFMAAGPIGAVIGGLGGLFGGVLGGRKQREQEHRQKADAWAQMQPDYIKWQSSIQKTMPTSGLSDYFAEQTANFDKFRETGGAAWKYGTNNSTQQFQDVGTAMYKKFHEIRDAFRETIDPMIEALNEGRGMDSPFADARNQVYQLGQQLLQFIDDTQESLAYRPEEQERRVAEARAAAIEQAKQSLDFVEPLSALAEEVERFEGAALGTRKVLMDLGMAADEAGTIVDTKLTAALSQLGENLERDLRDQIDALDGKAYLASFRDLIDENLSMLADIAANPALNVDTSLVETFFQKSAQALVDGAELTGAAFDELIAAFPQLSGVVTAFAGDVASVTDAVATATSDLDRAMSAHTDVVNERIQGLREEASELERTVSQLKSFVESISQLRQDLLVNDDLSPLSNRSRLEEAQREFRDLAARAATGDEDAQSQLASASQEYLEESRSFYASSEEYYRNFTEVQRVLADTEDLAKRQLTEAQRQLDAIERSIRLEEEGLLKLQEQIDALLGIDKSVLSVAAAIAALKVAQSGGGAGGGAAGGGGGSGSGSGDRAAAYLAANPDILAGISNGQTFGLPSGASLAEIAKAHWEQHGKYELSSPDRVAYANGGLVTGPGTGTSDSIRALLSNGEFVVPARAVTPQTYPVLEGMRMGRMPGNDPSGITPAQFNSLRQDVQALGRIIKDVVERQTETQVETSMQMQRRSASSGRIAERRATITKAA